MDHFSLDVVVTRGAQVESLHQVHAAVVNASGTLIGSTRNPALVTHWRSCAKPFQIMPLVESSRRATSPPISCSRLSTSAVSWDRR